MQQSLALKLENDRFYPANQAAKLFAELNKTEHLSAEALDLIERIGGYKIVVRPYVKGQGQMGSTCQIIRLQRKML